ncbi:hypothetical protein QBC38DRAFT_511915 [Podospora fimiseda]|uniref:Heterokaryon incompatibility domain-containing protein n=1 Tax=Podospora fimiseda TaxID=252190 RepID=A0AAN7BJ01_9PEZI|nr:hypothetical protein QBC38DRAFT_511915 [Podospora fimiseda]
MSSPTAPTAASNEQPQLDPDGNNRWHLESCQTPDVNMVVGASPDTATIFCRACMRAPNIPELIARHNQSKNSHLIVPPDEPYGEYNLWWPRSVPYTKAPENPSCQDLHSDQLVQQENEEPVVAFSSPYHTRLKPYEFRLISPPAVSQDTPNRPIHIKLETHLDERHPEYETVSYTWGGEDNDASLCRPIYVGPYWDVLLQTKNCWDMPQYLQPLRGHRYEAKMDSIYRNCSRAVLWLGKDVVKSTAGEYPLRRSLDEVAALPEGDGFELFGDDARKLNFRKLLQHRYFSRVWVTQELLSIDRFSCHLGTWK